MKQLTILALFVLALSACAGENDYFPLLENSTYSYHGVYKKGDKPREFDEQLVLKAEKRQDEEYFFFIAEKDERNPMALIGTRGIGRGLYFKRNGEIAALECLMRGEINALKFDRAIVILKNPPQTGQTAEAKTQDGLIVNTWTVEGFEDIAVPAGTFKQCVKLKLEEKVLERKVPELHLPSGEIKPARTEPEKKLTGYAWLALGVGLVKWQRVTGRVDELSAYKLAEPKAQ